MDIFQIYFQKCKKKLYVYMEYYIYFVFIYIFSVKSSNVFINML